MYACEQVMRKGKMLDFLLLFFLGSCIEREKRKTEPDKKCKCRRELNDKIDRSIHNTVL